MPRPLGCVVSPLPLMLCETMLPRLTRLATLLSLRSTSSLMVRVRPQQKNNPPHRETTKTAATTMPAMAPADSPCFCATGARGTAVELGRFEGSGASGGNGSPGLSMYALLRARSCCVVIEVLELGLMAPTMPYLMHDPGAEQ